MSGVPQFPDLAVVHVNSSLYVRRIVSDILGRSGIRRVLGASDAAEGLELLSNKPDVAIIDWNIPILSGPELVRMIRNTASSPMPRLPIIVTIAQPRAGDVERACSAGAHEILAKPFSPQGLWSRIQAILESPRRFTKVGSILRPAPRVVTNPAV